MTRIALALVPMLLATPAVAEVKSASDGGFEIVSVETVKATPAAAYDALRNPGQWWNGEHTYSGDAKNMTIDARAGGCFCEKTEGGGTIEHGRIIYTQPGKTLRFTGGLGPLQSEAITATLTWTIEPAPGGAKVTQRYVVSGYMAGGLKGIAPVVDKVLAEQLGRLKAYLDKPAG